MCEQIQQKDIVLQEPAKATCKNLANVATETRKCNSIRHDLFKTYAIRIAATVVAIAGHAYVTRTPLLLHGLLALNCSSHALQHRSKVWNMLTCSAPRTLSFAVIHVVSSLEIRGGYCNSGSLRTGGTRFESHWSLCYEANHFSEVGFSGEGKKQRQHGCKCGFPPNLRSYEGFCCNMALAWQSRPARASHGMCAAESPQHRSRAL